MIDPSVVAHVARLARLGLSDEEAEVLREQLSAILDYVGQLSELELRDAEVRPAGPARVALRPDAVTPSLPRAEVLANAPDDTVGGLFRAPAVLD